MKQIKIGIIGLGQRGSQLMRDVFTQNHKADVVAVCDLYGDRVNDAVELWKEHRGNDIYGTTDYKEVIVRDDVEAVMISCAWEDHIPIALEAMEAGKKVALEVGGAYSVDDCWQLVRTSERTGLPVMFLENCCFGKRELMIKNMVDMRLFGEIVHCSGGYMHDLREEVAFGEEKRHYRLRNYLARNCENYPTHELGPIAKILGINKGNRMVSLVSVASKAAGLREYIKENKSDDEKLVNAVFRQGDVITTIITCAGGETITLQLDTTLPRPYSRGFTIRGTKAMYQEDTDMIFFDGEKHESVKPYWGSAEKYEEKYLDPTWKKFIEDGIQGGHGGMDWLLYDRVLDCCLENIPFEIDVYDAASWMCISALSEQSIAMGGAPVAIPDFTCGKWIDRK